MKRIIDGKTFNTQTAAKVASAATRKKDAPFRTAEVYLGRHGEYFVHYQRPGILEGLDETLQLLQTPEDVATLRSALGGETWRVHDEQAWSKLDASVKSRRAGGRRADADSGEAVITLRLPRSLKTRIDAAARGEGISINAWCMRLIERGLETDGKDTPLGR